jgi:hypothetical protein
MNYIIVLKNKNTKNISYFYVKNPQYNIPNELLNLDKSAYLNTNDSFIIRVNDIIHFYNEIYYKKIHIDTNDLLLSNENFYIKLNENNYIYLIDNYFKILSQTHIPFKVKNIIVKNKIVIIECIDNNYILINKYKIVLYKNFELFDLHKYIILHSNNKNILIDEEGFETTTILNNFKTQILINALKKFNGIDNLINCYIGNEMLK